MRHHREKATAVAMTAKQRLAFAGAGALIALLGIMTLANGNLHYANWWGGAVFAPFAILVGALGVAVALFARHKGQ